ncbi:MAG TPA: CBS domain-containing protein [Anaeromyxobacter sp.]|nr:CBS domain-containing protein [Anaeromyxobacter sp.]
MAAIQKQVTREVVTLNASAPMREAAEIMEERRIGSVAVREGDRIVGLVTERDLMRTVCALGLDPGRPIREALRSEIPRVAASSTEAEVASLMRDHTTRHLLVEEGGAVVGVISMRDIIQLMLDEKEHLIGQLHAYIEGR